jgi:hypothetical protein
MAWQELQWYEPRVTNTASSDYSTTFDVESVGGADGACVLKFRFERNLTHVLVNYEGPVRFDLDVVEAAREREGEGWLSRDPRARSGTGPFNKQINNLMESTV